MVVVVFLNIILLVSFCSPIILDAERNGYQDLFQYMSGWYYYPQVTDYYNQNIRDNGVTVGFFCHDLVQFSANRTIIDLDDPIYGSPLYSVIGHLNESASLSKFEQLNVKYLLIPMKGTAFYPLYEKLR